jgi:hypothetical protein
MKKSLKEEIESSNENFIDYIAVIDSTEILQNNRSMMTYIFPDVKMNKLINWYDSFSQSEQYQKKDDRTKLESISSRFHGDGTLKILYRSLNALLSEPFTEPEKTERDKDVKKLIKKIGIYIKQKLTDEDNQTVQKMLPALESTSQTISDKIESKLLSSMKSEEETEEEPDSNEEPKTNDTETSSEEQPEPVKKESKISKYHQNKLRKKIKEMVRRSLTDKKISGLIRK